SIFDDSKPFSSPCFHSTPTTQSITNPDATIFKTPVPSPKSKPRPATRLKETYGLKMKYNQNKQ
ncbi:unnamed protein product, partial [Rotaria sp. Silwood2]